MTFLQPWMLLAAPLVALPLIIHLINQRRFQTMPWAAMMFLLTANRMSRGYARLRQWLILAFRMLAIAGLLFVISRPLASGWLGAAAGGSADATLVLLDRSPSMQQIGVGTATSKLDTAKRKLRDTLGTLGTSRVVLIDSGNIAARELESLDALVDSPGTGPAGNTADVAAMLQEAYSYVKANRVGRADVWIVSDLRESDWDAGSGRWSAIRDSFKALPQTTRFHLLSYAEPATENLTVQVTEVRREQRDSESRLLISLRVFGNPQDETERQVPLQFEIDGARSETTVALVGGVAELKDHAIPIEQTLERGWGRVNLPADANQADNEAFFVFDDPPPRKSILVTDDPQTARPLMLAAEISANPLITNECELVAREQLATVPWEEVSLLMWQGELPSADEQEPLKAFVKAGGQVIFFPPKNPSATEAFGIRWLPWVKSEQPLSIEQWRGDQDLLANTISGASLPVGQLQINQYAGLEGRFTPLATLSDKQPLLVRVDLDDKPQADEPATADGIAEEDEQPEAETASAATDLRAGLTNSVYFCATTPSPGDSSLARDGVVLYVAVQRAIENGASALGSTRTLDAGSVVADNWRSVAGAEDAISSEYGLQQGIFATEEKLVAVNRSAAEDIPATLKDATLQQLFGGLDFSRVDDTAGDLSSLVQEIWRLFLVVMIIAMIVEAALCLPRKRTVTSGAAA